MLHLKKIIYNSLQWCIAKFALQMHYSLSQWNPWKLYHTSEMQKGLGACREHNYWRKLPHHNHFSENSLYQLKRNTKLKCMEKQWKNKSILIFFSQLMEIYLASNTLRDS